MTEFTDKEFVERVRAAAVTCGSLENLPSPHQTYTGSPIASWFNGTSKEILDIEQVLAQAQRDEEGARRAVCVVENIDWRWICAIGNAWAVEPIFFAEHGVSPQGEDAWSTLFPKHRDIAIKKGPSKHKYVDGVFEHHHLANDPAAYDKLSRELASSSYQRRCWIPPFRYSPSCCTRLSYCRVNANLCMWTTKRPVYQHEKLTDADLFLVDPPPELSHHDVHFYTMKTTPSMQLTRMKTTLRVQCGTSRGGITLPQVLKRRVYSFRQTMYDVFKHSWHLNVLFDQGLVRELAINRGELLHLMAASLHQTNLKAIDREIKSVSFQELRRPDMATNAKLLDLREVLSELATGTAETSRYVPRYVKLFYETLYDRQSGLKDHLGVQSPVEKLAAIKQEASELERFLMDSFQLLMSSLSAMETQTGAERTRISMEQAARTARLTQLAFIYVPLTFVTGIFGMNIKEISEPEPSVWVCFVTLVIVAAATAVTFGWYELLNMMKQRQSSNVQSKTRKIHQPVRGKR